MQERVLKLIPRVRKSEASSQPPPGHSAPDTRPTICTFHSLCVRILRQHIEKLGYQRNFVIYDESDQLGVIKKILSRISAKGEETDPAAIVAALSRQRNGGSEAVGEPGAAAMAKHIRPS